MFKRLFLLVLIAAPFLIRAQDTLNFEWKEIRSYKLDSNEVWACDVLENVFTSKDGVINKHDSIGEFKFSQSIKSLGRMQRLLPINTMKLVHFSDEQQTLCFLDNTLTPFNDCIDLIDADIVNAKLVAESSRSDMIWVFDNLNSKLVLLPLAEGQQQRQEIDNLKGVLDINEISQIIERNNRLYLVDQDEGVYIFDLYGSLIEFKELPGVQYIDANKTTLYAMLDKELKIIFLDSGDELTIDLPEGEFSEFRFLNQRFFLRSKAYVHKFALQLKQ